MADEFTEPRLAKKRIAAAGLMDEALAMRAEMEAAAGPKFVAVWGPIWMRLRERVEGFEAEAAAAKAERGESESEDEDIQWAYENHSVKGVAESDAPSSGAASMLRWARDDFKAFMAHRRDLRKQKQSTGDGERIVRQWTDKQKETIKGQLAKISKAAEELVLP